MVIIKSNSNNNNNNNKAYESQLMASYFELIIK